MKKLLIIMAVVFTFVSCNDEIIPPIPPCECIKTSYEVNGYLERTSLPTNYTVDNAHSRYTKVLGVEKVICQDVTKSVLPYDFDPRWGEYDFREGVIIHSSISMLTYYRITCN